MSRFAARRAGGVEVRLEPAEADLLLHVVGSVRGLVEAEPDDPAVQRLFPPAYTDDPEAEASWREYTRADLTAERLRATDEVLAGLGRGKAGRKWWTVSLTGDETQSFLAVLNDVRLVLGIRLGVTEEWYRSPPDLAEGERASYEVYGYLGWVQAELLQALDPTLEGVEPDEV